MTRENGETLPEGAEFEFNYDVASFLSITHRLTLAGLSRITGVSQGQLSHYVTGHRKPSARTVEKYSNHYTDLLKIYSRSILFD